MGAVSQEAEGRCEDLQNSPNRGEMLLFPIRIGLRSILLSSDFYLLGRLSHKTKGGVCTTLFCGWTLIKQDTMTGWK